MKIMHYISTLGGGGAELQLAHLCEGLVHRGWSVHVGFTSGGLFRKRLEDSGVTLHPISSSGNFDPRILTQLLRITCEVKPDLVQTWLRQMDILGGIAAFLTGTPQIVTERTSGFGYAGRGWRYRTRLAIGARAAAVVSNSQGGLNYWSENARPRRNYLIRNGLSPELSSAGRNRHHADSGEELIVSAGRFSPEKNVLLLAEALLQVLKDRPNARAIMFGEGILKEEVHKMRGLSLAGARLSIRPFTAELPVWLTAASVFVSASLYEGHPNAVLEAAAAKCPLVLSDIEQHREIMDENSATFSGNQAASLAKAIEFVLCNPEVAVKKSEQAYLQVQDCSVEKMVQGYVKVYEEILQSHNKAGGNGDL